jgi:hypothetical protein
MAHYALVNKDNVVLRIIVCDQDPTNIDVPRKEAEDVEGRWLQTSYNTRAGVHYNSDGVTPSGKPGLRFNYAGINFTYSDEFDAFIPPRPSESWKLDTATFQWTLPAEDIKTIVAPLTFKTLNYSSNMVSVESSTNVRII